MATTTTTNALTSTFTPAATCSTLWTYEPESYNEITGGILIQQILGNDINTECYPPGWVGYGRVPTTAQVFSPGACPQGYTTAGEQYNGAVTTANCCSQNFTYLTSVGLANEGSILSEFVGCTSLYSGGATSVAARTNYTTTGSTIISVPLTMWAQPVNVAFQQSDLSLFPGTTTGTSSVSASLGPSSASAASTPTNSAASQTSSSSSTAPTTVHLSSGAIAGIVIGAIAAVAIVAALAFMVLRRRRKQNARYNPNSANREKDAIYAHRAKDQPHTESELEGHGAVSLGHDGSRHELQVNREIIELESTPDPHALGLSEQHEPDK